MSIPGTIVLESGRIDGIKKKRDKLSLHGDHNNIAVGRATEVCANTWRKATGAWNIRTKGKKETGKKVLGHGETHGGKNNGPKAIATRYRTRRTGNADRGKTENNRGEQESRGYGDGR